MNLNILSVGHAAALIQAMPHRIRDAARALGIEPGRINGVEHFEEADVEKIAAYLRSQNAGGMSHRVNGLC